MTAFWLFIAALTGGIGYLLGRARKTPPDASSPQVVDQILRQVTSEGILVHQDGVVIDMNDRMMQIADRPRDQIIGRRIIDLLGPHNQATVTAELDRENATYEVEHIHLDGSRGQLRVNARSVQIDGRRLRVAVIQDLTERRKVELAFIRTQQGFRAMIERLPFGIALHHHGITRYANPSILHSLGFEKLDDVRGRPVVDFILPEDRPFVVERTRELLEFDQPLPPLEIRFMHRDGRLLRMETLPVRMIEFEGELCHLVVVVDVSDKKILEERLQFADRMASVGTLAAGMAHEVNNPLSYVIGHLELMAEALQKEGPAHPLAHHVKEALEGSERVRRTVTELKTFSRASDESVAPTDVREVMETAIRLGGNEIRHRAQLRRHFDNVPLVDANASRLSQVFVNLLINAAQAIAPGQAESQRIDVYIAADGPEVTISVQDTGAGIPLEVQKRIFDPFFTTKPVGEGTGLGLSICHGIVASLGGSIRFESTPGHGTRFTVRLPARPPLPAAPPTSPAAPSPEKRIRILVIDDEPAILELLSLALAQHQVHSARGGQEGLDACLNDEWDVVLCDLMMPEVSGMDVYARIAEVKPELLPRVVFLTGGAFTLEARDFLSNPAIARLDKPFRIETLKTLIAGFVPAPSADRKP